MIVAYGPERTVETAVCERRDCSWKRVAPGATSAELLRGAEEHVRKTGHSVTLHVDKRTTLRREL